MKATWTVVLLAALAVLGLEPSSLWAAELRPGDMAPEFKLQASDGKTYRLSDFRGKKLVVLAWFPKAFTPGCTLECRSFAKDGKAIGAYEVAYFTASIDTPEYNGKFAQSLGAHYPILGDASGETARAYGVIDDQQKYPRRWTFYIGLDGRILDIDKSVRVATHATDVASRLKELGAPARK